MVGSRLAHREMGTASAEHEGAEVSRESAQLEYGGETSHRCHRVAPVSEGCSRRTGWLYRGAAAVGGVRDQRHKGDRGGREGDIREGAPVGRRRGTLRRGERTFRHDVIGSERTGGAADEVLYRLIHIDIRVGDNIRALFSTIRSQQTDYGGSQRVPALAGQDDAGG